MTSFFQDHVRSILELAAEIENDGTNMADDNKKESIACEVLNLIPRLATNAPITTATALSLVFQNPERLPTVVGQLMAAEQVLEQRELIVEGRELAARQLEMFNASGKPESTKPAKVTALKPVNSGKEG